LPSSRGKTSRHPAVDRISGKGLGSKQESTIVRHAMYPALLYLLLRVC
jgi:hypothetical protein